MGWGVAEAAQPIFLRGLGVITPHYFNRGKAVVLQFYYGFSNTQHTFQNCRRRSCRIVQVVEAPYQRGKVVVAQCAMATLIMEMTVIIVKDSNSLILTAFVKHALLLIVNTEMLIALCICAISIVVCVALKGIL